VYCSEKVETLSKLGLQLMSGQTALNWLFASFALPHLLHIRFSYTFAYLNFPPRLRSKPECRCFQYVCCSTAALSSELLPPLLLCCIGCPSAAFRSCFIAVLRPLLDRCACAAYMCSPWNFATLAMAIHHCDLFARPCLHGVTTRTTVVGGNSCPRPVLSMLLGSLS